MRFRKFPKDKIQKKKMQYYAVAQRIQEVIFEAEMDETQGAFEFAKEAIRNNEEMSCINLLFNLFGFLTGRINIWIPVIISAFITFLVEESKKLGGFFDLANFFKILILVIVLGFLFDVITKNLEKRPDLKLIILEQLTYDEYRELIKCKKALERCETTNMKNRVLDEAKQLVKMYSRKKTSNQNRKDILKEYKNIVKKNSEYTEEEQLESIIAAIESDTSLSDSWAAAGIVYAVFCVIITSFIQLFPSILLVSEAQKCYFYLITIIGMSFFTFGLVIITYRTIRSENANKFVLSILCRKQETLDKQIEDD